MWFDGPMSNLKITNNVIVDQIADGAQLPHRRHRTRSCPNNFVRNTGDDGWPCGRRRPRTPATRSTTTRCRRRRWPTASRSTAAPTTPSRTTSSPTRSARAAAIQVGSRFGAEPFTGHLWITNNTTVRAGTYELNWNIGLGAIWFYALEKNIDADIEVVGDNFLDNTYNAIMLVSDFPVKDLYSITERPLQGHQGRRHRHLGAQRPGRPASRVVRERGRPQRRRGRHQQLRVVPLHPGRLGVLARPTSAATTAAAPPARGSPRGSCRTPSPATTARRSWCRRRRRPGERELNPVRHHR